MLRHKTFFTGLLVALAFLMFTIQVRAADHENPEVFTFHTMAPPVGKFLYTYLPVVNPVLHVSPPFAKPVGVGSVAVLGNMLTVMIALNEWDAPVDIYGAYAVNTDPGAVHILNPNGSSFTRVTMQDVLNTLATGNLPPGVGAWKENLVASVSEQLINTPTANLPSGTYTAYLMATTANTFSTYYLWVTVFVIP
jgi:hypothetical protein